MKSGGRSRAAALALLLGVIAVLGAAVIVPTALHWTRTGTIIEDARLKIQRSNKRTEASETLDQTKQAWSSFASEPRAGFVLSTTDDEGIAETTIRLQKLFAEFDGTLNSVSGSAAEGPRAGVRRLSFSGSGILPREKLTPFLTVLESKPAFLIISEFKTQIRAVDRLWISFTADAFRLEGSGA